MGERVPRKDIPGRSRLEGWLVRKIHGGGLKALPRYSPLQGRGNQCADQYARTLLAGLRQSDCDTLAVERLKDDGRAFRSWVETALASLGVGRESRDLRLTGQSFV